MSFLCLTVLSPFLVGHDLFIKLDDYFLAPDTEVRVPILNGSFALSENSVTSDRIEAIVLARSGETTHLDTEGWDASGDTTFLTLRTGEPGTYLLGVSTKSRLIELDAASFNEYLEHDGIPDVLEARRVEGELEQDAVERYSKHVKAVFQVGDSRGEGWERTLGFSAEIVPLANPYALRRGDALEVRCLVFGRPVASQLVIAGGVSSEGAIAERKTRTDENGVARFTLEDAGVWYVKFIHMEETDDEEVDYESNWATLSFQVR
jgi:hypothetical protein